MYAARARRVKNARYVLEESHEREDNSSRAPSWARREYMERENLSRDYLHRCRELHERLTQIRYGRTQHLYKIEDATTSVRSRRRLTYDDIEKIRDSEIWDAKVFGYWPPRAEVESIIESTEWDFWNLPKRETKAITDLFQVFRQIEPVSVVLRFLVPEHYGIISPPVEKVLWLGSFRRHPEKYQAYLANLRELRDEKGFETAADVDMALWVLQVGVRDNLLENHLPKGHCSALERDFKRDSKLRQIRAGNITRQLFSEMSRPELAEALLATNIELAGQIAGIEFERSVRRLTRANSDDDLRSLVKCSLPDLIHKHYQGERSVTEVIVNCREAVKTRNHAVHSEGAPSRERTERLINAMNMVRGIERVRYLPHKVQ